MPEVTYAEAPEVAAIAAILIETEPEFEHLKEAFILYTFCDVAPKRNGEPVFAATDVVKGKNAHLYYRGLGSEESAPFYRIVISEDLWEKLDEDQHKFLVRHSLRHCGVKNNKKGRRLVILPHDTDLFLADLTDTCWESVCAVWQRIKEAEDSGQTSLPLSG